MTRTLARCKTPEHTQISLTAGWYIDVPYAVRVVARDGTLICHIWHTDLDAAIRDYTQTVDKLTATPQDIYVMDIRVAERIAIARILQGTAS